MHQLEQRGSLCRYPWLNFAGHVGIAFLCLTFVSPLTCALVSQRGSIPFKHLEPEAKVSKRGALFVCTVFAYRILYVKNSTITPQNMSFSIEAYKS